jgi:sulfite exporter TauE/SafE
LEKFLRLFQKYKRFLRWSETAAGLLLISMGLLMLAGRLTWVLRLLPPAFYGFAL